MTNSIKPSGTGPIPFTLLLAMLAGPAPTLAVGGLDEGFECVVMPYRVLDLSTGVSGRLEAVAVERAEHVQRGQELARLESEVEHANLKFARARARMVSEVRLRESGLEFDQRRRERVESLHQRSVASEQERDEAGRAAEVGRWQVAVARDNLHLAGIEAQRAEALLELRTVAAPFDGVVMERFKSPGEYVDEEPVLRVAQLDPLRVEVIVPIEHYGEFQPGLATWVHAETEPDQPWRATVTAVDAVGDPASGTFRARLELPNPDRSRLAGIKCTASLIEPEAEAEEAYGDVAYAPSGEGDPGDPADDAQALAVPPSATGEETDIDARPDSAEHEDASAAVEAAVEQDDDRAVPVAAQAPLASIAP